MIPDFTAYMVPPWNFALGGIFFAQMLEKFYETFYETPCRQDSMVAILGL